MFRQWFDAESSTYTYLIADPASKRAVLIDPVLGQLERDETLIAQMGLTLAWVLDTHVHADHVTAASQLRARTGCKVGYPSSTEALGADRVFEHGEHFTMGAVDLEVRHTPGHTSGSACFVDHANRRVFTGDTLLIRGCGRTDFQGGSPAALYTSVHEQLFTLDDDVLVYPGHDYEGRTASSIGEERSHNNRLGGGRSRADFIDIMDHLGLSYPSMIDIAVPANKRLGQLGAPWERLHRTPGQALQAPVAWVREHGDTVRLVDVREPEEFNGPMGHVPNAELVPLDSLSSKATVWDKNAPVVLICASGARSDRGALLLEALGFRRVASMTGGTTAWNQDTPTNASCG